MNVLDLCAGHGGLSRAFVEAGDHVETLDIDPKFGCTMTRDILQTSTLELMRPFQWDVILAGVPCNCFSVASISTHWTGGWRVYEPKTEQAKTALLIVQHTLALIRGLAPVRGWVMENPRGVLRKLPVMEGIDRRTVTYCQYGDTRMKPTDLWGGFPSKLTLKPICKNGDPCHERAPRGAKTGTQGIKGAALRAVVPVQLSEALRESML